MNINAKGYAKPTKCRHCGADVSYVNNRVIYGQSYGKWPYAYLCTNAECGAYVGVHPKTEIPLGTLANHQEREARKRAKVVFNEIWQTRKLMGRSMAYMWLAKEMNIHTDECHFGMFSVEQCEQALELSRRKLDGSI